MTTQDAGNAYAKVMESKVSLNISDYIFHMRQGYRSIKHKKGLIKDSVAVHRTLTNSFKDGEITSYIENPKLMGEINLLIDKLLTYTSFI